jgi:hypothetical protein
MARRRLQPSLSSNSGAANTLETLDFTASTYAILISRAWLQGLAPIHTLRRFGKLESLSVFSEMLYHCSTLTGGATITALLASLERLQIWRPSSHVLHILRHTLSADKKSQYLRLKAITFHEDSGDLIGNF